MHVERLGAGLPIVLVHGSVGNGSATWSDQLPLAQRFRLVIPDRPGFPPNAPVARIDFDEDAPLVAELLEGGAHLVGHSYGGVVALLAAPSLPLASLTVIEPPAFDVAREHPAAREFVAAMHRAPREPRAYLEYFLPLVGSELRLPEQLPPALEAGARAALAERWPSEARVPLDELAATAFPKLVVSGAHHPAFDAVCDVLEQRVGARRAVLPGAGHSIPRLAEPLNELLAAFLRRADGRRASAPRP